MGKSKGAAKNFLTEARQAVRQGRYAAAQKYLDKALEMNVDDAESLALRGRVFVHQGDLLQAIGHYMLAIQAAPDVLDYKEDFIALAGRTTLSQHNEHFENILLLCLEDPRVDCISARFLWQSLLMTQEGFRRIYQASDKRSFDGITDFTPLLSPLFLKGLQRIVVYDPVFETFMTSLRRALLLDAESGGKRFSPEAATALAEAVSFYCFETEYIFDCTEEEKKYADELRRRLEDDEKSRESAQLVALYACYAPLYTLQCAGSLSRKHRDSPGIKDVIRAQITDWDNLEKTREQISALTEITDETSMRVREQYEEFPYPKISSFVRETDESAIEYRLRGTSPRILIAGCGTGREAFELASLIPDADILAIDLSRISLAYATNKMKDFAIPNITFRQADILRLGALQEKFDCISCGGVLHHLKEPVVGWKTLVSLLKPGGMMRIALYSKTGRLAVAAAREVIAREKFSSSLDDMKLFRKNCRRLLDGESLATILATGDFYYSSRLRDYLFHVQEHRFDLLQIEAILKELGLEFVRFNVLDGIRRQYAGEYPGDMAQTNLRNWHAFEEKHPQVFSRMYQFWCRKVG